MYYYMVVWYKYVDRLFIRKRVDYRHVDKYLVEPTRIFYENSQI